MVSSALHVVVSLRLLVILRHVRAALEGVPGGRVLLLESVVAPGAAPDLRKLIDYEMLMMTGRCERSEPEFAALLRKVGFHLSRIVRLDSPLCVIEVRPR